MTTDALLTERKKSHGEYREHAAMTQGTMDLWARGRNFGTLSAIQRESLHMFAHKVGRILVGDPDKPDHWADIAGYATLIVQRLPPDTSSVDGLRGEAMRLIDAGETVAAMKLLLGDDGHEKFSLAVLSQSAGEVSRPGTPEDGGHHAGAE
jgi:hypothetical protein